jgi:predicted nucleic acid-binding protein
VILVDTSVWVDHLHSSDPRLIWLLETSQVLAHPMVVGELSLGGIRERRRVIDSVNGLPQSEVALHDEVMILVEQRLLFGKGLSLVDAHLLASVILTHGARLWTADKRLREAATELSVAYEP